MHTYTRTHLDDDAGAGHGRDRLGPGWQRLAVRVGEPVAVLHGGRHRRDGDVRDVADAGERLAAEAQRGDGLQVLKRTQLAGGVPARVRVSYVCGGGGGGPACCVGPWAA
jgi:hypothetical protein